MTNAQPNEQATWPLNVSAISKSFDGNQVLADVNLQLAPGQVVGLVGANGAGKSTLAKLLANQLAPDSERFGLPANCCNTATQHLPAPRWWSNASR